MSFESVGPSAVRAIRQRDFLKEWFRLYAREQALPAFEPARIGEEMPELMFYNVEYVGSEPRYRVTHEGRRLIEAYGVSGIGHHLHETLSPALWLHLEPIYRKCASIALPVYSIFQVTDTERRKVEYERLLLPFGEGSAVQNIVASVKTISVEGRFINADLMSPVNHAPKYTLRAVIDTGLSSPSRHISIEGDVVEL
jgi:hypothetical protein